MPDICVRGRLIAITGYSPTSYFIYRGRPMGYEYELMEKLGENLDLDVEYFIARNLDSILVYLEEGIGDIVAYSMTVTKSRLKQVSFTIPHMTVRMVLIQRKPAGWRQMKAHEIRKQLIRNPVDLIGRDVYVRRNSSYYARLQNLSEEIGGDILIHEADGKLTTNELIRMVDRGELDFTVADDNVARLAKSRNPNIDIQTPISLLQQVAWAVRKDCPQLLAKVNEWLSAMQDSTDYYVIYNKYYKNRTAFQKRAASPFYSGSGGGISPWDETLKEHAGRLNWDWRLLASLIFQESQFDPEVTSWAGAKGLMQLMPETAKQFGIRDTADAVENIRVGVDYLLWLENFWTSLIPDSSERLKFILGSYNAGFRHVEDARRLAVQFGRNPDIWDDNVAFYLMKKAEAEYYNHEVVEYGYCRGEEPVNYVSEILDRYQHYEKFIDI